MQKPTMHLLLTVFPFGIVLLFFVLVGPLSAAELSSSMASPLTSPNEVFLFFEEEAKIIIATKQEQTVRESPAVASVVSAEEIRKRGDRRLMDTFRRVPGFGVTRGVYGKLEVEIRGLKSLESERIKFLVDGHTMNEAMSGGIGWVLQFADIDRLKRIEIVRGPGSALYGSNAFSGTINLVTKDGADVDGVRTAIARGAFDTWNADLQAGRKWGDLDIVLFADYLSTDGPRVFVPVDAIGNSGFTNFFIDRLDLGLKIRFKGFRLQGQLIRAEWAPYISNTLVVNDESVLDTKQGFLEIGYARDLADTIHVDARAYYDEIRGSHSWELLPEGTGPFVDGMIGRPAATEWGRGAEIKGDLKLPGSNVFTVGALVERRILGDTRHQTNFDPTTGAPLGPLQDVTAWANFIRESTRDIRAVYLQNIWRFIEDASLTVGARYDDYSDFGSTFNPRAAVVWQVNNAWDVKALFGTAFLAPSFLQLYLINNPAAIGNPNLDPERMRTFELSSGYSADWLRGRLTLFHNRFKDRIFHDTAAGALQAENIGGATVKGVEAEMTVPMGKKLAAYANYTYLNTQDDLTNAGIPEIPPHKGNVGLDAALLDHFTANVNLFMSGKRPRTPGDTRSKAPGYALVDLTLIAKNFIKGLEFRGSAHNLLDKEYVDPLPVSTIPGDLPREGRSWWIEAMYHY